MTGTRQVVKPKQAAQMLQCSIFTIHRLCNAKKLKFHKLTDAPKSPRFIYADSIVTYARKLGREITV